MSKAKNKIDEKDILEFFKYSYFGNLKDPIEAASNRAYRDMCRTLRFGVLPIDTKATTISNLIEAVNVIFKEEIPIINEGSITSQEKFDSWHCKVCKNIKLLYNEKGIEFTYGQAQKWVNMTIKYLYILNDHTFDNVFDFLHIPVDNYILDIANKNFEIDKPKKPWSKWDEEQYRNYQNEIKSKIKIAPLLWEFDNWLEVAKSNNKK